MLKTSINELQAAPPNKAFQLKNKRMNAGRVKFSDINLSELPTIVDILKSGYEVSLTIAIDFTSSNIHKLGYYNYHSNQKTQYEEAI